MRIQVPIITLIIGLLSGILACMCAEYPDAAEKQRRADLVVASMPLTAGKIELPCGVEVSACYRTVTGGNVWFFYVPGDTAQSLNVIFIPKPKPEEAPTHE